jgi:hypothetical protein
MVDGVARQRHQLATTVHARATHEDVFARVHRILKITTSKKQIKNGEIMNYLTQAKVLNLLDIPVRHLAL